MHHGQTAADMTAVMHTSASHAWIRVKVRTVVLKYYTLFLYHRSSIKANKVATRFDEYRNVDVVEHKHHILADPQ